MPRSRDPGNTAPILPTRTDSAPGLRLCNLSPQTLPCSCNLATPHNGPVLTHPNCADGAPRLRQRRGRPAANAKGLPGGRRGRCAHLLPAGCPLEGHHTVRVRPGGDFLPLNDGGWAWAHHRRGARLCVPVSVQTNIFLPNFVTFEEVKLKWTMAKQSFYEMIRDG